MSKLTLENLFGTESTNSPISIYSTQYDAIRWLQWVESELENTNSCKGGILADEQGLGKTREIMGLCEVCRVPLTMIITTTSTTHNWIREALTTAINCNVITINKGVYYSLSFNEHHEIIETPKHREFNPGYFGATILIVNHDKIITDQNFTKISIVSWDRICIDEAHFLRNGEGTLNYNIISAIPQPEIRGTRIGSRFAVTGTPIQNSINDIVNIFQWIDSRSFKNASNFECELKTMIRYYVFRRNKYQIRPELKKLMRFPSTEATIHRERISFPDTLLSEKLQRMSSVEIQKFCQIPNNRYSICDDEKAFYIVTAMSISKDTSSGTASEKRKSNALEMTTNLKTLLACPYEHVEKTFLQGQFYKGSCVKINKVLEILSNNPGKNFVIFQNFLRIVPFLRKKLQETYPEIRILAIDGSVPSRDRDAILMESQRNIDQGFQTILFLAIQATGEGLNCQMFSQMILLDLQWNPKVEMQAISRIYRIGQPEEVHIYYILINSFQIHDKFIAMDDTIENIQFNKNPLSDIIETKNAACFFKRLWLPNSYGILEPGSDFGEDFESRVPGSPGGPDSFGPEILSTYPQVTL
jgi:SNF2 family DNA or RNA helicase